MKRLTDPHLQKYSQNSSASDKVTAAPGAAAAAAAATGLLLSPEPSRAEGELSNEHMGCAV